MKVNPKITGPHKDSLTPIFPRRNYYFYYTVEIQNLYRLLV